MYATWLSPLHYLSGLEVNPQVPDTENFQSTGIYQGSTISPETLSCQVNCGDRYYTCAVIECEKIGANKTDPVQDNNDIDEAVHVNQSEHHENQSEHHGNQSEHHGNKSEHHENQSEHHGNKKEHHEQSVNDKDHFEDPIDRCWIKCRNRFRTCFDKCSGPQPTRQYSFDWSLVP